MSNDEMARALRVEDDTALVCPRCAVVSEEANEWRVNRVRNRNQRNGVGVQGKGKVWLNSPGLGLVSPRIEEGEEEEEQRRKVVGFRGRRREEGLGLISRYNDSGPWI